jgi:ubiquinone/menaquinone biosynthesis C-methylase UbiE
MKEAVSQKLITDTKDGYNRMAKDWAGTRMNFWSELSLITLPYIQSGTTLLDFGCGNGRFYREIQDKTVTYTGCDISKGLLEQAWKHHPELDLHECSVLDTPFQDNHFDTLVSFAVLHHIPGKENHMKFFEEIHRVLKPGGIAVVSIWNIWKTRKSFIFKEYLRHLRQRDGLGFGDTIMSFTQHKNSRYVYSFSQKEIHKLITKNSFHIIKEDRLVRDGGEENFVFVIKK